MEIGDEKHMEGGQWQPGDGTTARQSRSRGAT
ncbi:hypothetical protein CCACVL1_25424, partial [Corchorus capsularis]